MNVARKPSQPTKDEQPVVTNLTSTKKVLRECAAGFEKIDEKRAELNDQAADLRERCRNQGIDPKWLLAALRIKKMEPEDREKADENYAIARDAIGIGMQSSLFDTIATADDHSTPTAQKGLGTDGMPALN
jgi:uncharacterized protein (UPF0335 family)